MTTPLSRLVQVFTPHTMRASLQYIDKTLYNKFFTRDLGTSVHLIIKLKEDKNHA